MKAHVRMRKWGSGLIAWGKLYQGDVPPLRADEPMKEPKVPDGADKYGRIYEFPSDMFPIQNQNVREFRQQVFEIMQGVAELRCRAALIEAGPIVVRRPDAAIRLDHMTLDVCNPSNGKWVRSEAILDFLTERWVDVTGMVKEGLPEGMNT